MGKHLVPIVLALLVACSEAGPAALPSPSPTETELSTTASPVMTKVPNVVGRHLSAAKRILNGAGLHVDATKEYSKVSPGIVIHQTPIERLAEGSTVVVVVAQPFPSVPNVIGLRDKLATRTLVKRGFDVRTIRLSSGGPAWTVISQTPAAGVEAKPGDVVTLRLA
jgi:resuscitation-promoting factor RpfB